VKSADVARIQHLDGIGLQKKMLIKLIGVMLERNSRVKNYVQNAPHQDSKMVALLVMANGITNFPNVNMNNNLNE